MCLYPPHPPAPPPAVIYACFLSHVVFYFRVTPDVAAVKQGQPFLQLYLCFSLALDLAGRATQQQAETPTPTAVFVGPLCLLPPIYQPV